MDPELTQTFSAVALAKEVAGPESHLIRLDSKKRLSSKCEIFVDAERMIVVARPRINQKHADLALAWGLAYRGDRTLSVILPSGLEVATLIRLPWIQPQVRLFTYDQNGKLYEPEPLTEGESLNCCTDNEWKDPTHHSIEPMDELVDQLLQWLKSRDDLKQKNRPGYLAWKIDGQQVMKIMKHKSTLTLTAGFVSKKVAPDRKPVQMTISTILSELDYGKIVESVSLSIQDKKSGIHSDRDEHRLQSLLTEDHLGLADMDPEFAASRPGQSLGFVDFLGVDDRERIHIVETKIGTDPMLVLQGLDYWLWARANERHIVNWFGKISKENRKLPLIHFVVQQSSPTGRPYSIYAAAHLEALHRDIEWKFSLANELKRGEPPLSSLNPLERIEDNSNRAGRTPPRWRYRFLDHAAEAAKVSLATMQGKHMHVKPEELLVPAALPIYRYLKSQKLDHTAALSVNSSQTFALNLFAPLSKSGWTQIARDHLNDSRAEVTEDAQFEYVDPDDALQESSRRSNHRTQVDCMVPVTRGDGNSHMMLIEVKLTEDGFSTCSAFDSSRNDRKHVCATPLAFGGDPGQCFQLANHDHGQRRKYDVALGDIGTQSAGFGCWFRDGGNQIMRNVALARTMIQRGKVQSASVLLMAPQQHRHIWEQWRTHIAILSKVEGITFGSLFATDVVALHGEDTRRQLTNRYALDLL